MKLTYRILWIEDEAEFVESFDTEALAAYIEEQGFDLELEIRSTPEEIHKAIDGARYDLLVVDFNVSDDEHGSDIIRRLREHDCLTEVVFYSQNGVRTLREEALEKELDGVFISSRERRQLSKKISDVFNLTVRKVVDVDNMRGMVMAGVADLDHLVSDVLREVHARLDSGQQTVLCKKLLAKMRPVVKNLRDLVVDKEHASFGEVEKLIDAVVQLDPEDLETLLRARSFDSSKRVDAVVSMCKQDERLKEHKDAVQSIKGLLAWRNALAHQKPTVDANGVAVFEPKPGTPESFDAAKTLSLRQQMRAHRQVLAQILGAIRAA